MRKALLVLAAVLVSGAAQANEATWKWDGEIRTRYNYMNNTDLNEGSADETNNFQQRNKFGMTVNKGERLMGRISLINHFNWGNEIPDTRSSSSSDNTQTNANGVNVHEAYMWWKANDMVAVMAGRIAQEVADGSVISNWDFAQHPYTFDGVGLQFDLDFANIMGFGVKGEDNGNSVADDQNEVSSDPETIYYGLTADLKNLPDVLNMVHLHFLNINVDPENEATPDAFAGYRYGLTVAGAVSGFDFRGTYAAQEGELRQAQVEDDDTNLSMSASMIDVEAGYTLADVMGLRIAATYHTDTGDDTEATSDDQEYTRYDGFYYDQHKYAGLMDVLQFGNLTYTGVMVSLMPQEDVTVGLGYYMFSNTSADDQSGNYSDRRNLVTATAGEEQETELGTEIDVWVEKTYDNGFSIRARYGMFTPGAYFEQDDDANNLADDLDATEQQGMVQATLMF